MGKYICTTSCYWGPESGKRQSWKVGETYDGDVKPCKHFESVDKVQGSRAKKEYRFMDKEALDWTPDDMELATKKQLNEKFELGLNATTLHNTGRVELISSIRKKNNPIPRSTV